MIKQDTASRLYAIVRKKDKSVLYTIGGSSTPSKLMVYGTEKAAKAALRYVRDPDVMEIILIYDAAIERDSCCDNEQRSFDG